MAQNGNFFSNFAPSWNSEFEIGAVRQLTGAFWIRTKQVDEKWKAEFEPRPLSVSRQKDKHQLDLLLTNKPVPCARLVIIVSVCAQLSAR